MGLLSGSALAISLLDEGLLTDQGINFEVPDDGTIVLISLEIVSVGCFLRR